MVNGRPSVSCHSPCERAVIDSHCHIDLPAFDHDRAEVLQRAISSGVSRVLVPGLDVAQVKQLPSLQKRFPMLDLAAGFHPFFLSELPLTEWQLQLKKMTEWVNQHQHEIVAIGEFGLDATLPLSKTFQQAVFTAQLSMAQQFKKPVILHHRKSHNDIIRLLKLQKFDQGGVIHAFSGSAQIAQTYVDLGFKLGVGGTITYPRGEKTRNALKHIALEALLLETDAPDMPLCGYQGMRNSPEQLILVAERLAELKQCSIEELKSVTTANYMSLFSSMLAP